MSETDRLVSHCGATFPVSLFPRVCDLARHNEATGPRRIAYQPFPRWGSLPQIRIIHPASRAWCAPPRAFRNEVPHIGHQHVAAEPRDQCFLAILTTTRIAREPHHAVRPFGEGWSAEIISTA
jgi:hypothetical protein